MISLRVITRSLVPGSSRRPYWTATTIKMTEQWWWTKQPLKSKGSRFFFWRYGGCALPAISSILAVSRIGRLRFHSTEKSSLPSRRRLVRQMTRRKEAHFRRRSEVAAVMCATSKILTGSAKACTQLFIRREGRDCVLRKTRTPHGAFQKSFLSHCGKNTAREDWHFWSPCSSSFGATL